MGSFRLTPIVKPGLEAGIEFTLLQLQKVWEQSWKKRGFYATLKTSLLGRLTKQAHRAGEKKRVAVGINLVRQALLDCTRHALEELKLFGSILKPRPIVLVHIGVGYGAYEAAPGNLICYVSKLSEHLGFEFRYYVFDFVEHAVKLTRRRVAKLLKESNLETHFQATAGNHREALLFLRQAKIRPSVTLLMMLIQHMSLAETKTLLTELKAITAPGGYILLLAPLQDYNDKSNFSPRTRLKSRERIVKIMQPWELVHESTMELFAEYLPEGMVPEKATHMLFRNPDTPLSKLALNLE